MEFTTGVRFTSLFLIIFIAGANGFEIKEPSTNTNEADPVYTLSGRINSHTRWTSLNSSAEALLRHLTPEGVEDGVPLFLCRAPIRSIYRSGSLWAYDGNINCRITNEGGESLQRAFQVLEAPIGSTSWVPYTGTVPSNAIIGGNHDIGFQEYICRGFATNRLIIGNLNPGMRACYVAVGGEEFMLRTGMEILVINSYGSTFQ